MSVLSKHRFISAQVVVLSVAAAAGVGVLLWSRRKLLPSLAQRVFGQPAVPRYKKLTRHEIIIAPTVDKFDEAVVQLLVSDAADILNDRCSAGSASSAQLTAGGDRVAEVAGLPSEDDADKPFIVVGLDCEWRRGGQVALLQLATGTSCALFRVISVEKGAHLPANLVTLLESRRVLKVGVGISDDASKLRQNFGVNIRGCIDLSNLVPLSLSSDEDNSGPPSYGLQALTLHYLQQELAKPFHVRVSNWEAEQLTDDQIVYAAHDALVAVDIFCAIESRVKSKFTENEWRNILVRFSDAPARRGTPRSSQMQRASSNSSSRARSTLRPLQSLGHVPVIQVPLYDNCQLLGPDGEVLCTMDKKRAKWYLEHNLGDIVPGEGPMVVRLKFKPSGSMGKHDQFYLKAKDNKCVVCGAPENLQRKHIIPLDYRRHFPVSLKGHTSHDVLLLCVDCHRMSNWRDVELRDTLAFKYNAPLQLKSAEVVEDKGLTAVVRAARALSQTKHKLPEQRRTALLEVLADHFNVAQDEVTSEMLEEACAIAPRHPNSNYVQHGKVIVDTVTTQGPEEMQAFIRMWRQHFLDTMRPNHLPEGWSVEHRLDWVYRDSEQSESRYFLGRKPEEGDEAEAQS